MPFFVNTEKDDLLVIYFKDYKDLVLEEIKDVHHSSADPERSDFALDKSSYVSMARLYHKKRSSPYRNYVRTNKPVIHDVIYLLVIDREEKIDRLHRINLHKLRLMPAYEPKDRAMTKELTR